MTRRLCTPVLLVLAATTLVACAEDSEPSTTATSEQTVSGTAESATADSEDSQDTADSQEFPDILEAELSPSGDEFQIDVTVSSPYDTPDRYADGWRVLTLSGDVLAEHVLHHDHQNEQPFTRSRGPFSIPADVDEVVIEGRDQDNGYGGKTVTVEVPR